MSDSSWQTPKNLKQFHWNSTEAGKEEFAEMMALFMQSLGDKAYIMNKSSLNIARPINPGPAPEEAKKMSKWQDKMEQYNAKLLVLYRHFDFGVSVLRSLLPYPTMARTDLESALIKPVDEEEDNWTPDLQFQAVFDKLTKTYSRSSSTDTDTLRRQAQMLSDQSPGGFIEYQNEFQRIVSLLHSTSVADVVTEKELREWVKKGIQNETVFNSVTSQLYLDDPEVSYSHVFERVNGWLSLAALAGRDPYKLVNSSKGSVNIASTRGSNGSKPRELKPCTKCWGTDGHWWRDCTSSKCKVCGKNIGRGDPTCPGWRAHKEPKFRFHNDQAPFESARSAPSSGKPLGKRPRDDQASAPDQDATESGNSKKAFYKAFRAEWKKQKKPKSTAST